MKLRPITGLALAVAAVGAVNLGCRQPPVVVENRETPARVTALGRLEPAGQIIDVGGPAGARLDHFDPAIHEGARVKQGDVIAYLDSYEEALAARDQAATQLDEAGQQRRAEEEAGGAAVDDANLQIRHADRSLPLQIQAQEAEVRRSTVELEKLRADLARAEKLKAGNAIVQSQYDTAVLAVRQAEELLARNKATLAQLNEDRAIQAESSRAALRAAQAARTRGELSARVQSLTRALKLAEARLDQTRVKAPTSGEVFEIVTHPGEAIQGTILKMGDTATMVTVAEVYETDVRFVRVGQKATITSRALAQPVTGQVERIGTLIHKSNLLGTDPTAATDARVIEVRIKLDGNSAASRYNRHEVQVSIETGQGEQPGRGTPPATSGR